MMPGGTFLSNLSRRSNPAAAPEPTQTDDVHQFKKCMQEIQRDYPNLPIGAQQKLALERCSKSEGREEPKRFVLTKDNVFFGIMSKLRLHDEAMANGMESTDASPNCTFKAGQRQSLNPLKSVVASNEEQMVWSNLDWSDDDTENSLQDSLDDIEKGGSNDGTTKARNTPVNRRSSRRASRRSVRQSLRMSDLSVPLFDVEEDAEHEGTDAANDNRTTTNEERQIPPFIPDIILVEEAIVEGRRQRKRSDKADESQSSSFLSVDSANFQGDFWAWRSITSR